MMTTQQRCSEETLYGWGRCSRTALVERDGEWYCWQHDPVRLTAKAEAARREREETSAYHLAQFDAMQARRQAEQEAAALIVRLAAACDAGNDYRNSADNVLSGGRYREILALAARLREFASSGEASG